jgi:hypothetical protein
MVYTCDCCGFQNQAPVEFNNAPGNSIVPTWSGGSVNGDYCNSCIRKFNAAIKAVFQEAKGKEK